MKSLHLTGFASISFSATLFAAAGGVTDLHTVVTSSTDAKSCSLNAGTREYCRCGCLRPRTCASRTLAARRTPLYSCRHECKTWKRRSGSLPLACFGHKMFIPSASGTGSQMHASVLYASGALMCANITDFDRRVPLWLYSCLQLHCSELHN